MIIELSVLGTASQLPTLRRNHGGYYLRWQGNPMLLDPGEGTQRQCILAGLSVPAVRTILISHFHGDHCLGLPGVIQRLALAEVKEPVTLIYPEAGWAYLEKLLTCSAFHNDLNLIFCPVAKDGLITKTGGLHIEAFFLRHRIPVCGYRVTKPGGWRFDKEKLQKTGISGKAVGILEEKGELQTSEGLVKRESVSRPEPSHTFSYIADTSDGDYLDVLMNQADLVLCETTFMESETEMAEKTGHMTTRQAAERAAKNKAGYLVSTHFSERYHNQDVIEKEIRRYFPRGYAADDFMRYSLNTKSGLLNIEEIWQKI